MFLSFASSDDFEVSGSARRFDIGGTTIRNVEHVSITFGDGDDTFDVSGLRSATVDAGEGDNSLTGTGGADTFYGGQGDDEYSTGAGNDSISDRGGNNTISTGAGNDAVSVGYQFAHNSVNTGSTQVDCGAGDDSLFFIFTDEDNVLDGGAGTDTLTVLIQGYSGFTFALPQGDREANLRASIVRSFEVLNYWGADGDDRVTGGSLGDSIVGEGGNNVLRGEGGDDELSGGIGTDRLYGGAGNDHISANGYSHGFPDLANDRVYGGRGDDTIYADRHDYVDAGSGNDEVVLWLDGNPDYDPVQAGVSFVVSSSGSFTVGDATVKNAERLTIYATDFADAITAGTNEDTLHGEGGDDILRGAAGNDVLWDGLGNDRLFGGDGADTLYRQWDGTIGARDVFDGGGGIDGVNLSQSYSAAGSITVVDLLDSGRNTGNATGLTLISIESVLGSYGADRIFGTNGTNWLDGFNGNDVINGRDGDDYLFGGEGSDTLIGGRGRDHFYFSEDNHDDVVTDFSTGDRIALDKDWVGVSSVDDLELTVLDTFADGGDRSELIFVTSTSQLWRSGDEDHDPVLLATLQGMTALDASVLELL